MASAYFYVVYHEDQWKIRFNEKYYGPFDTKSQVFRVAVSSAYQTGRDGHDAQVKVQGADRKFGMK